MIGASTDPTVYPNVYFQCDGAGILLPASADWNPGPGHTLQQDSSQPDRPHWPEDVEHLSRESCQTAGNPNASYNYVNEPVRSLNETKFDIRLDHTLTSKDNLFGRFSYDQAFSFVPGGAPGLAEANAFGSNENLTNHATQHRHWLEPCVLAPRAQPGHPRLRPHLRLHRFDGKLHLRIGHLRNSGRRSGLLSRRYPQLLRSI